MTSFFKGFTARILAILAFTLFGLTSVAQAQIVGTTSTASTTPPPVSVGTTGLTTWSRLASTGIGQSSTTGTGKLVTGEALSIGDESFKFAVNANVTGFQPGSPCAITNCLDGKNTLTMTGYQLVGSGAQGRSTNDGSQPGGATSKSIIGSAAAAEFGVGFSFVAPPKSPTTAPK